MPGTRDMNMNEWMTSDLQELTASRSRDGHTLLRCCVINALRRTRTNSSHKRKSSQLPLRKEGNPSWGSWCSGGFSRTSRHSHPECTRGSHKGRPVKTQSAGKNIRCPLGQWGLELARVPSDSDGKESTCNAGDTGSLPGRGRSPAVGNGNPLQYSCLEKSHAQRSLAGHSPQGLRSQTSLRDGHTGSRPGSQSPESKLGVWTSSWRRGGHAGVF